MANPSSIFDLVDETLAQFLAKSVSDGTQADVFNTLKTDAPGQEAAATAISTVSGQLLSNGLDDFFQASYPLLRGVARNLASEFGVVADGVTDDTAAMQLFLNAGGGELPGGIIITTAALKYFTDTVMIGQGVELTEIRFQPSASVYALESNTPAATTFGLRISRLKITYTSTAAGGIHLERMSDARIEQVTIDAITGATGDAVRGSGAASTVNRNVLEQLRITDALNGVKLDAGVNGFLVHACEVSTCTTGCRVTDALNVRAVSSRIRSCTSAVIVEATGSGLSDGCVVAHNNFEGNTTNINVAGFPVNVRGLVVAGNFHADGIQYANVFASVRPGVVGDSSPTADTNSQLSGNLARKRDTFIDTTLVSGDFALGPEWGATATINTQGGTDSAGFIEIIPSGAGILVRPTITLTFSDGAWGAAPLSMLQRNDVAAPLGSVTDLTYTSTTTTLIITFHGLPVSGNTYRFEFRNYG